MNVLKAHLRITIATMLANGASQRLLSDELRNDPVVHPSAEVRARLVPSPGKSHSFMRALTRAWTRFKTRQ